MPAMPYLVKPVMRRCFMTGKQCIFSSQNQDTDNDLDLSPSKHKSAFVIMPMRPNFGAFYQWSLKPFLDQGCKIKNIQIADEVRDIGYIICEKICRKIQESDLVLADISLSNPNVFYEIGLAYGLKRPIVIMQNDMKKDESILDRPCYSGTFDFIGKDKKEKIFTYEGVKPFDHKNGPKRLDECIIRPPKVESRSLEFKIRILSFKEKGSQLPGNINEENKIDDLRLDFNKMISGAVAKAMNEIKSKIIENDEKKAKSGNVFKWNGIPENENRRLVEFLTQNFAIDWVKNAKIEKIDNGKTIKVSTGKNFLSLKLNDKKTEVILKIDDGRTNKFKARLEDDELNIYSGGFRLKPWEQFIANMKEEWDEFLRAEPIISDCREITSKKIVEKIEKSFCTLIDITGNDSIAYFWLGYCHARGLNVIPVNRVGRNESGEDKNSKLAFDIRALWYAEYDSKDPNQFKDEIREILEHLMERDLSDLYRRTFWERFPAESPLKVFVGAIHSDQHTREVVGDWDVRVVSDLFSYLPSVREATTIKLIAPLYSPEESLEKEKKLSDEEIDKDKFNDDFCKELDTHLSNSNAIIIASPDVNPLTEYLLYKIYNLGDSCKPFNECNNARFDGYIAFKKSEAKTEEKNLEQNGFKNGEEKEPIKRLFYRNLTLVDGKTANRGFIPHVADQDQKPLHNKYFKQGEIAEGGFRLLGHLLIAGNPINVDSNNLVVILNGISGPATLALAEILTGGGLHATEEKRTKSEEMLKEINLALDNSKGSGIEAIIEVQIDTPESAQMTFADTREVSRWEFFKYNGPRDIKSLRI